MSDYNNFNENPNGGQPEFGYAPVAIQEKKGMSIASLVLGIVGFVAWCIPLIGYPVTIVGIILGALGMKKGGKGMAIAGIICSAICLVITIINSVLGVLMATSIMPNMM